MIGITVLLIILAVLLFCLIIVLHEFGHFITAKLCGIRVNEFALGMGPKLFQFQKGETTYSLRAFPIGGFCAMEGENGDSADERSFGSKPVWKRMIVLASGAAMNILIGFLLMFIVVVQQPMYTTTTVAEFTDDALTNKAGLQVDDTFYAIDGYRTYTARDVTFALSMADANDVQMTVIRNGEKVTLDHVQMKSNVVDGKIYSEVDFRVYPVQRSIATVFSHTMNNTVSYTRMVWASLWALVTGQAGLDQLSGPVGTATVITKVASSSVSAGLVNGINNILLLMVILTINLGVINLLPLPALDGGRLLFLVIEAIRGKPIDPKYEGWVHAAGFVALMLFMILITFQDIVRIFQ
ncbi:MAG: site-2 protease family protein [Oscillospiraceae bacterium]|nr:site-2 protease family protein [Oscillospiraceae bacterium]